MNSLMAIVHWHESKYDKMVLMIPEEGGRRKIVKDWKDLIMCATECSRCHNRLSPDDPRILSCYDHDAICMDCKKKEERNPDYEEVSKKMIGQCMIEVELKQSDPAGYCFNHFYPYRC